MKLRERKANAGTTAAQGEPVGSEATAQEEMGEQQPRRKKTPAEYQKDYRRRIKESEIYEVHCEHEQIRLRLWRLNRTPEVKEKEKEQGRIRGQRYRQKQKSEGGSKTARVRKKVTRAESQALQEKWRDEKRRQRSTMSMQKRRRLNEKRREKYAARIMKQSPSPSTSTFPSDSARRKAVQRSFQILPKNPQRFAEVMASMVKTATPRRKTALKRQLILSPRQKRRLDFLNKNSIKAVIEEIKLTRSRRDLELRRLLHVATTIKNNLKKKTANKEFGLSWNFLRKPLQHHLVYTRKRRSDTFNNVKARTVIDFYNRSDITRELPLARSTSPVKIMECTGAYAFKLFKEENPRMRISFSLFQKLRPADIKPMSKTKLLQCLCEYCINITFMLDALKHKAILSGKANTVIKNKYDAAHITVCESEDDGILGKKCIDRTCDDCGVGKMKEHFADLLNDEGTSHIQWKSWEMVEKEKGRRMTLKVNTGRLDEIVEMLTMKLEPFAKHLANSKWQAKQFDHLKKNVPADWLLLCMDFAENYNCHFQDEAQSAHWAYNQATIHPIVAYYRCPEVSCNKVTHESLMFVSDDRVHDQHAVHHFVSVATQYVSRLGVKVAKEVHFSDGAGAQYKNKTSFQDASYGLEDLGCTVEKHFFGSRHGKGPCDGEIGVLKKLAGNAVKSRQVIIADAHDLFKYGRDYVTRPKDPQEHCHSKRTFFLVRDGEVNRDERKERSQGIKPVPKTRSLHAFRGVAPNVVAARERTCFCTMCMEGDHANCTETAYVGTWKTYSLSSGREVFSNDNEGRGVEQDQPTQNDVTEKVMKNNNSVTSVEPEFPRDDPVISPSVPTTCNEPGTPSFTELVLEQGQSISSVTSDGPELPRDDSVMFPTVPTTCNAPTEPRLKKGPSNSSQYQDFLEGSFVAVKLYGKQSCGVYMAEFLRKSEDEVLVKFMKRCGDNLYMWPTQEDLSWEPLNSIVCMLGYPALANKREQFRFSNADINKIEETLTTEVHQFK